MTLHLGFKPEVVKVLQTAAVPSRSYAGANFASQSHWENYLLGPTAAVLAFLCVIVARSPMTSHWHIGRKCHAVRR
jgi:hypothetical protein